MFAASRMMNPDGTPTGGLIATRATISRRRRRSPIPTVSTDRPSQLDAVALDQNEGSYGFRVNYSDQTFTIE